MLYKHSEDAKHIRVCAWRYMFLYSCNIYIYIQAQTQVPLPLLFKKILPESFSQIRQTPYFAGKTITAVRSDGRSVCNELFMAANYKLADLWRCGTNGLEIPVICNRSAPPSS